VCASLAPLEISRELLVTIVTAILLISSTSNIPIRTEVIARLGKRLKRFEDIGRRSPF
jgi:hypothetical protein